MCSASMAPRQEDVETLTENPLHEEEREPTNPIDADAQEEVILQLRQWVKQVEAQGLGLLEELHTAYSTWLPPCKVKGQILLKQGVVSRGGAKWRTNGFSCGPLRHSYYIDRDEGGEGLVVGRWSSGVRVGPHWIRSEGGVWRVVCVDEEGRPEGEGVVLYPDLTTVLAGQWRAGLMVEGRRARLGGLTRYLGVPWPVLLQVDSHQVQGSCQ